MYYHYILISITLFNNDACFNWFNMYQEMYSFAFSMVNRANSLLHIFTYAMTQNFQQSHRYFKTQVRNSKRLRKNNCCLILFRKLASILLLFHIWLIWLTFFYLHEPVLLYVIFKQTVWWMMNRTEYASFTLGSSFGKQLTKYVSCYVYRSWYWILR